ncbi:MAG: hypothetical protein OHK0057_12850 [Thermoflexibacter sp.]
MVTTSIAVKDYLDLCERVGMFFEYVQGQVYWKNANEHPIEDELLAKLLDTDIELDTKFLEEMPTLAHRRLVSNLHGIIFPLLKKTSFEIFNQDTHIWTGIEEHYRIPDLVITDKEQSKYLENRLLTNPIVLIEVLSPSTQKTDKDDKVEEYLSTENLTDYLLVSQDKAQVWHYKRNKEDSWTYKIIKNKEKKIDLESIKLKVSVKEIYEGVL